MKGNTIFLRYTALGNADGQLSKVLVVVEVKNMADDDFFVCHIRGLSHSSEVGSSGYIMFVQKRSGNALSNQWIHENYIIPEISRSDEMNENLPKGGMQSAIYIDGESSILSAAMLPEVQQQYRDSNIIGVKGVPSGTSLHQGWDVSTVFMDIRASVDAVARNGTNVSNEVLSLSLERHSACCSTIFLTPLYLNHLRKRLSMHVRY